MKNINRIKITKNLYKDVENKFSKINTLFVDNIKVGDNLIVNYNIGTLNKIRTQKHEGIVIAINKNKSSKNIILRYILDSIGIEHIFPLNSPKMISITKKEFTKVRKAKLYHNRVTKKN